MNTYGIIVWYSYARHFKPGEKLPYRKRIVYHRVTVIDFEKARGGGVVFGTDMAQIDEINDLYGCIMWDDPDYAMPGDWREFLGHIVSKGYATHLDDVEQRTENDNLIVSGFVEPSPVCKLNRVGFRLVRDKIDVVFVRYADDSLLYEMTPGEWAEHTHSFWNKMING